MDNIYQAWDTYATGQGAAGKAEFAPFARQFLLEESRETRLPLNEEQTRILVEIIDSFVDGAQERHRKCLGHPYAEDEAARDLIEEIKTPVFTRDEIEQIVKDGSEEFAGLNPDEIRNRLKIRNNFFSKLKVAILSQQGTDFGEELQPYLSEADRTEAGRLFSTPVGGEEYSAIRKAGQDERQDVANMADIRSTLALGNRAKELERIVADESADITAKTEAPKCLLAAFTGKLLSDAEKLARKLTAVEFLLARMALGDDEEAALPFLAVGAARCAYDWVTEHKSAIQLGRLGSALEELEPGTLSETVAKEVDHVR